MPEARTGLAQYLLSRYSAWKSDRKNLLESKWQANLNAMKRVDDSRKKKFKKDEAKDWRSEEYIGIIKAKVYTVFSILVEILVSKGKLPFSLMPSPYERDFMPPEMQEAQDAEIDKMEDRIRDQQKLRNAVRETMKKLLSLLIYGACCSKYNIEPVARKGFQPVTYGPPDMMQYGEPTDIRFEEYEQTGNVPGHIYTSLWNMFWDHEGGNLKDCDGYCERKLICVNELRKKKGKPFYIDEAIDRVISEFRKGSAPEDGQSLPPGQREIADRKKTIVDLEFWCRAPVSLVNSIIADLKNGVSPEDFNYGDVTNREETEEEVEILCELADSEIVRIALNETGERPHKLCFWEVELDEMTGEGIPDNLMDIQYLLNGLTRAFLDNKKLSGNVIAAIKRRYLKDQSQLDSGIKPGTILDIADSCDDARKAFMPLQLPDAGASLTDAIGLMWSWKDTLSLVPEILQGSTLPKQKSDTAYELSQLLQFGSKYISLGVANFDEAIIEPEVTDLYRYNMRDPEVQEGKGPWIVHATGFTTLQDKLIKTQILKELLGLLITAEPLQVYAKVRKHLEKIYDSLDLDPDEYLKTEEEIQQALMEQQALAQQQMQAQAQAQKEAIAMEQAAKAKQDEDNFQRDMIKEGVKLAASAPKQTSQGG